MLLSPVRFALRTLRLRVRERGQNSKVLRNGKRDSEGIVTNPPAGREEVRRVVRLDFDLLREKFAAEGDAAIEGDGREVGAAAAFGFNPGLSGRDQAHQTGANEVE